MIIKQKYHNITSWSSLYFWCTYPKPDDTLRHTPSISRGFHSTISCNSLCSSLEDCTDCLHLSPAVRSLCCTWHNALCCDLLCKRSNIAICTFYCSADTARFGAFCHWNTRHRHCCDPPLSSFLWGSSGMCYRHPGNTGEGISGILYRLCRWGSV